MTNIKEITKKEIEKKKNKVEYKISAEDRKTCDKKGRCLITEEVSNNAKELENFLANRVKKGSILNANEFDLSRFSLVLTDYYDSWEADALRWYKLPYRSVHVSSSDRGHLVKPDRWIITVKNPDKFFASYLPNKNKNWKQMQKEIILKDKQIKKETEASLNTLCEKVGLPQDEYGRVLADNLRDIQEASSNWLQEAYIVVRDKSDEKGTVLWTYFHDNDQELTFYQALNLAIKAARRHNDTNYDQLLKEGFSREDARAMKS